MMKRGFEFLKLLQENNNREWFQEHKLEYDLIKEENKGLFNQVFSELQKHDSLNKIHISRIYRDIRFSKDKTPFKTNFGASFSRVKPFLRGGYYIQLGPGESFVGGGFWAPNKDDLFLIRKEFERNPEEIRQIIAEKRFLKYFGKLDGEEAVKNAPKGFDKTHPSIELIKKKQFVVRRSFTDQEVLAGDFLKEVILTFLAMRPFFDYMSEVLTTDQNGESLF
ncbi:DUF2461 domain-containing protein [Algoriphagus aestuarii]|nr:DUF2461 domain-containing protein [Algoriphagus aestuarii]